MSRILFPIYLFSLGAFHPLFFKLRSLPPVLVNFFSQDAQWFFFMVLDSENSFFASPPPNWRSFFPPNPSSRASVLCRTFPCLNIIARPLALLPFSLPFSGPEQDMSFFPLSDGKSVAVRDGSPSSNFDALNLTTQPHFFFERRRSRTGVESPYP